MQSLYSNLISYWSLQEAAAAASRADFVGQTNNLTDSNSVGQTAGVPLYAASFVRASSKSLTLANNANIQTGDIDFTFNTWVNLTSKPAALMCIAAKFAATSGNAEYFLYWDNAADRFSFAVYRATDSGKIAVANTLGAPATATWYMVTAWHDAAADTVNIEANAGVTDSTATTGALQAAGTAAFGIGGVAAGSFFDGAIGEVGFWKRVLTRQERSWLYNNGRGRTYPFDKRLSAESTLGRDGRHRRNRIPGMIT